MQERREIDHRLAYRPPRQPCSRRRASAMLVLPGSASAPAQKNGDHENPGQHCTHLTDINPTPPHRLAGARIPAPVPPSKTHTDCLSRYPTLLQDTSSHPSGLNNVRPTTPVRYDARRRPGLRRRRYSLLRAGASFQQREAPGSGAGGQRFPKSRCPVLCGDGTRSRRPVA